MKYTLLVEGEGLLEAKHKCVVDVSSLSELKAAVLADLGLSENLTENDVLMELFDTDFAVSSADEMSHMFLRFLCWTSSLDFSLLTLTGVRRV